MKRAFLFPGQGTQVIGMGKDIYENYEEARGIYDRASKISGIDIKKICFEGPEEVLNQTQYTQIAILTTSLAILEVLKNNDINAEIAVGLSLGEYVALIYAGIISFEDGIRLIQKRGYYMDTLVPDEKYSMAAVIGLDSSKIEKVCKELSEQGKFVVPANYNCQVQTVISGKLDAIDEAIEIANQSPYGLCGCIITENMKTAFKVASELEVGGAIINGASFYRSAEMPFGGWKHSGIGNEGITTTLQEMSRIKTIVLKNVLD